MTMDASDIQSFIGDIGAARLGYGFAEIFWDTLSKVGMATGDDVYLVVGRF